MSLNLKMGESRDAYTEICYFQLEVIYKSRQMMIRAFPIERGLTIVNRTKIVIRKWMTEEKVW